MTGKDTIQLGEPAFGQKALENTGQFLQETAQAALYAAAQEPLRGVAQLLAGGVNAAVRLVHSTDNNQSGVLSGHWTPDVDFMRAPIEAQAGTSHGYARSVKASANFCP
jgi:hypothetical protein